MRDVTVCFTYFKSLGLANLGAALYSVRRQKTSRVASVVIVANDVSDSTEMIEAVINGLSFPVPVRLLSFGHGDPTKTHSWSTNAAVREAGTPWVLFTRADYLLDFDALGRFLEVVDARPDGWDGFVTGNVRHLHVPIEACEQTDWRQNGAVVLRGLHGTEEDYMHIDAGVWLARKAAFDRVGGLDEALSAWGHAQTHFQHKLYQTGTEFVRIPESMFYHPKHVARRDIDVAHQQLREHGVSLKEMWARYEGVNPYASL